MNKINALLIDDEAKIRQVMAIKLGKYCPEVNVLGTAANVDEGYKKITELKPDLVFLDIAMPNGSGFDLLLRFEDITFEIIFVTGFNDYVLDALRVSAVDYLLKPVLTEDLVAAVDKARQRIIDRQKIHSYDLLRHNIEHLGKQTSKIAIPGVSDYSFLEVGSIIRCEGIQGYTHIYLTDGSRLLSSYNIGVFRELLESYDFYCIHKSHLVNLYQVVSCQKNGEVHLSDGSVVPVARRRRDEFLNKIKVRQE